MPPKIAGDAAVEADHTVSRELYTAVDEHLGELKDKASQDEFLRVLINEKNLVRMTAKGAVKHTVKSLWTHLKGKLSVRFKRDRHDSIEDFWVLGSTMFQEWHLEEVGMRPGQLEAPQDMEQSHRDDQEQGSNYMPSTMAPGKAKQAGGTKRSSAEMAGGEPDDLQARKRSKLHDDQDHEGRIQSGRKRSRDDSEQRQVPQYEKPSKKVKISASSDLSGNPGASELPAVPAQAREEDKCAGATDELRPSAVQALQEANSQAYSNQKQALAENQRPSATTRGISASAQAGQDPGQISNMPGESEERSSIDLTSKGLQSTKVPEEVEADKPGEGPEADRSISNFDDYNAGRTKAPLKDVRKRHLEESGTKDIAECAAAKETMPIFPPDIPVPGGDSSKYSRALYEEVMDTVKRHMGTLYLTAENLPAHFAMENDIEIPERPELVQEPTPALAALYKKVLGSEDWNSTFLRRRHQKQPWRWSAGLFASGLVAAGVYDRVFCRKQPWDIESGLRTALGDRLQYCEQVMDDRGYRLSDYIKQCSYKMIDDKKFQESIVLPHARAIAAEIVTVLEPHLVLLKSGKREYASRVLGVKWIKKLETLVHDSMILKGKVDSYWEADYEYFWPKSATIMDFQSSTPLHARFDFEQRVMLTVWPGIKATTRPVRKDQSPVTYYPCPAKVLTTKNLALD